MPEKREIKASVQKRSLIRELGKDAMDEIIVPKSKEVMRDMFGGIISMFAEAAKNSVDRALYRDGNIPNKPTKGSYTGTTNYQSYSRPIGTYQSSQTSNQPPKQIGQRPGNEVSYIWVWTKEDAEYLIGMLKQEIEVNKFVKVAKLYEELRQPTTFADFKYGWKDPNGFGYYEDFNRKSNEPRWFLDLPRPIDLTIQ